MDGLYLVRFTFPYAYLHLHTVDMKKQENQYITESKSYFLYINTLAFQVHLSCSKHI